MEDTTKAPQEDVEQGVAAGGVHPTSAPHVQHMEQFKQEMSKDPSPYEPGFAPNTAPGFASNTAPGNYIHCKHTACSCVVYWTATSGQ